MSVLASLRRLLASRLAVAALASSLTAVVLGGAVYAFTTVVAPDPATHVDLREPRPQRGDRRN